MKGNWLLFLVLIMLPAACEKDVYINIKDSEHKLVLSGVLSPDSAPVVHISQTIQVSVTGPADTTWSGWDTLIIDELRFFENDHFIGDLKVIKGGFYGLPDFRPVPGNTYRVEASAGERKPVSATTIIPEPVRMSSFDTTLVYEGNQPVLIRATIGISDPAGQKNYYALRITATTRYYDWQNHILTDSIVNYNIRARVPGVQEDPLGLIEFLDNNDPLYLNNKYFFTDELFNGKTVDLAFEFFQRDGFSKYFDTVSFIVELEQIDPSYYLYAVSNKKYDDSRDNPFTEPVQVYTNIKDGYGLFTSYTADRREFTVAWNDR